MLVAAAAPTVDECWLAVAWRPPQPWRQWWHGVPNERVVAPVPYRVADKVVPSRKERGQGPPSIADLLKFERVVRIARFKVYRFECVGDSAAAGASVGASAGLVVLLVQALALAPVAMRAVHSHDRSPVLPRHPARLTRLHCSRYELQVALVLLEQRRQKGLHRTGTWHGSASSASISARSLQGQQSARRPGTHGGEASDAPRPRPPNSSSSNGHKHRRRHKHRR